MLKFINNSVSYFFHSPIQPIELTEKKDDEYVIVPTSTNSDVNKGKYNDKNCDIQYEILDTLIQQQKKIQIELEQIAKDMYMYIVYHKGKDFSEFLHNNEINNSIQFEFLMNEFPFLRDCLLSQYNKKKQELELVNNQIYNFDLSDNF